MDVREGFVYMVRTPWLLGTLTFASLLIFLIMGPFEVLVPFVIKDVAGGGPADHAIILAAFGIGGAVGSAVIASLRMPRRYLTVMNLLWAFGCLPLAVFGLTDQIWIMAIAAFLVGAAFNGGVVIWGTLLQRRVPAAMLGRVSSLDFFVSLAFMPISMAIAGPAGESLGLPVVFLIAGLAPLRDRRGRDHRGTDAARRDRAPARRRAKKATCGRGHRGIRDRGGCRWLTLVGRRARGHRRLSSAAEAHQVPPTGCCSSVNTPPSGAWVSGSGGSAPSRSIATARASSCGR